MPFEDTQSVFQFLTVLIGCAIFLRVVGKEKYRREILLDMQPSARLKPMNASARHRKPAHDTASNRQDEAVNVAHVVHAPDQAPVR